MAIIVTYDKKNVNHTRRMRVVAQSLSWLEKKKLLILGFGREGRDAFEFLRRIFPDKTIGIADRNEKIKIPKLKKADWYIGENYLKAIGKYDGIVKSPGIPPKIVEPHLKKGHRIISATEIFFKTCPGMIIGVTGTKGKSTTSAMIYHILKRSGLKPHLVGNIGKPALSALLFAGQNDIFVYELSSHQLYELKKSPHIAVFLNLYPEHLDYYRNFEEYANAKTNIFKWQTEKDYLIYNSQDKLVNSFARTSKAKKIPIRGKYYELDREAARAVGKIFGIMPKILERSLKTFKPLPHRLELVGTYRGITFYNDSLSTIPETTIEALNFLGPRVYTLIAGGFDRGGNYRLLAKKIKTSSLKNLILFLPSGKRIRREVEKIIAPKPLSYFLAENMRHAVRIAFLQTRKGRICLLSPASPSFGTFRDYRDRGEQFKKYIRYFAGEKYHSD